MLTYRTLNAYFQYLKCLLTLFLMPIYNILKIYNGPVQLEIGSQKDRLSQEFVLECILTPLNKVNGCNCITSETLNKIFFKKNYFLK